MQIFNGDDDQDDKKTDDADLADELPEEAVGDEASDDLTGGETTDDNV